MTSDEQLIETLRKIKNECWIYGNCTDCEFNTEDNDCELLVFLKALSDVPCPADWDMGKIEKIVKESRN